jgi:hypothetical protein
MPDILQDYRNALAAQKDKPENVPKGTKITNDSVSLEAGRKKGTIKNLSVNYINLQRHLAKRDDGGREMVECNEAPFELFVANQ